MRNFGVDALTQIIAAALSPKQPSDLDSNNHLEGVRTPIEMQNEFLETLQELSRSEYPETREKSLNTLHQILQASGQVYDLNFPHQYVCRHSQEDGHQCFQQS